MLVLGDAARSPSRGPRNVSVIHPHHGGSCDISAPPTRESKNFGPEFSFHASSIRENERTTCVLPVLKQRLGSLLTLPVQLLGQRATCGLITHVLSVRVSAICVGALLARELPCVLNGVLPLSLVGLGLGEQYAKRTGLTPRRPGRLPISDPTYQYVDD